VTDTTIDPAGEAGAPTLPCPRCGGSLTAESYYGPCAGCRDALKAAYAGEARDVQVAAYEPKMNVTPNAVALKDD
jgi:hypothetical protein